MAASMPSRSSRSAASRAISVSISATWRRSRLSAGFAWARSGVADGEQPADLGQPQPEPLRAADEQQPVHVGRPVPAVLSSGPVRDRQQPFAFVVPDRVGPHSGPGSQLPDGQLAGDLVDPHALNAKPKFPPSRLADAFDQVVEPLITEIT
jgi:hypothetical protein